MSDRDSLPHTFIADIDERPFRLSDALKNWLRGLRRSRNGEATVRETLEEIIEERGEADAPINEDERLLLANILELRDRTIRDVMVPRADIVAVNV